jgi:hypothetical protein
VKLSANPVVILYIAQSVTPSGSDIEILYIPGRQKLRRCDDAATYGKIKKKKYVSCLPASKAFIKSEYNPDAAPPNTYAAII